jgi:hypothetical protein
MLWPEIAAEQAAHSDFLVVEGREKVPHVGVVTEFSRPRFGSRSLKG